MNKELTELPETTKGVPDFYGTELGQLMTLMPLVITLFIVFACGVKSPLPNY